MTKSIYPWLERTFNALAARAEQLPNALLLHGMAGIGKRALAEMLARALLCEGAGMKPCGTCEACHWNEAGNHPDLRIVEPEARQTGTADPDAETEAAKAPKNPSLEIKIEQIRGLADFLSIGSHRGGRRVAIVHPAEDMNLNAANALLKSLEEPPQAAVFLLVSDRPGRLLPTIRSRCIPQPVPTPDFGVAEAWLTAQGVRDAAQWLRYTGGSPLRALALSSGGAGPLISTLRRLPELGALRDLRWAGGREELESLVDYLQKRALDEALVALGTPDRYGLASSSLPASAGPGRLRLARKLGQERRVLRQPLNPALFVEACIAAVESARD